MIVPFSLGLQSKKLPAPPPLELISENAEAEFKSKKKTEEQHDRCNVDLTPKVQEDWSPKIHIVIPEPELPHKKQLHPDIMCDKHHSSSGIVCPRVANTNEGSGAKHDRVGIDLTNLNQENEGSLKSHTIPETPESLHSKQKDQAKLCEKNQKNSGNPTVLNYGDVTTSSSARNTSTHTNKTCDQTESLSNMFNSIRSLFVDGLYLNAQKATDDVKNELIMNTLPRKESHVYDNSSDTVNAQSKILDTPTISPNIEDDCAVVKPKNKYILSDEKPSVPTKLNIRDPIHKAHKETISRKQGSEDQNTTDDVKHDLMMNTATRGENHAHDNSSDIGNTPSEILDVPIISPDIRDDCAIVQPKAPYILSCDKPSVPTKLNTCDPIHKVHKEAISGKQNSENQNTTDDIKDDLIMNTLPREETHVRDDSSVVNNSYSEILDAPTIYPTIPRKVNVCDPIKKATKESSTRKHSLLLNPLKLKLSKLMRSSKPGTSIKRETPTKPAWSRQVDLNGAPGKNSFMDKVMHESDQTSEIKNTETLPWKKLNTETFIRNKCKVSSRLQKTLKKNILMKSSLNETIYMDMLFSEQNGSNLKTDKSEAGTGWAPSRVNRIKEASRTSRRLRRFSPRKTQTNQFKVNDSTRAKARTIQPKPFLNRNNLSTDRDNGMRELSRRDFCLKDVAKNLQLVPHLHPTEIHTASDKIATNLTCDKFHTTGVDNRDDGHNDNRNTDELDIGSSG
eukprot:CAMPEP_0194276826 /NCGR_PEP_ID=MMETSP0169-20130528/9309_1 /TAXON_ID=218684 /ORGANISM="Corethron pennatum, Strain L29A3" /LENGTH=733 /DNA_ID=CAMNT_0039020631 /DNA_START=578 /DNA_END=2776 /DNA_ORIENTATION=+